MVLQGTSEQANSDTIAYKCWEPQSMKTELWFPIAIIKPRSHPQWKTIGKRLAIRKSQCKANPMRKLNCSGLLAIKLRIMKSDEVKRTQCVLNSGKAVPSLSNGLLQPDRGERVHSH